MRLSGSPPSTITTYTINTKAIKIQKYIYCALIMKETGINGRFTDLLMNIQYMHNT